MRLGGGPWTGSWELQERVVRAAGGRVTAAVRDDVAGCGARGWDIALQRGSVRYDTVRHGTIHGWMEHVSVANLIRLRREGDTCSPGQQQGPRIANDVPYSGTAVPKRAAGPPFLDLPLLPDLLDVCAIPPKPPQGTDGLARLLSSDHRPSGLTLKHWHSRVCAANEDTDTVFCLMEMRAEDEEGHPR
jgi:hypothetical protein